MKVIEGLARFFDTPVETILMWLDGFQASLGDWWNQFLTDVTIGMTHFVVESVSVIVVVYAVYCACRIMMTTKDETFSEYINKSMIAGLGYFFAKYGGTLLLQAIGA